MAGDSSSFEVQDLAQGGGHTLVLRGELDIAPATDLEAMVLRLCAEGAHLIVIDLRRLTFMGSTGLRLILSSKEICAQHGCEFAVVPGPPSVQRLFEITGLVESITFTNDPGSDEAGEPDALELS